MAHDPIMPDEVGRPLRVTPVHIVTTLDPADPVTVLIEQQRALTAAITALREAIQASASQSKQQNDLLQAELVGIRARLNGGIRTQAGTITVGIL